MKKASFFKKIIHARVIAASVGIIMLLTLTSFVFFEIRINNQKKLFEITRNYTNFEDHIQTFLVDHSNLMRGFSAYIQTFDNYNENEVYTYLDHLVDNSIYYIRNIGILKNTTIIWNYPKSGNEKALGTDLAKIPEQAGSIARIKKTMKYDFDGPVNLVQGGTGYIMRIPIARNGTYWGMVSIVLKADKVKELFDSYAKECNLKVAILSRSQKNKLVYGEKSVMKHNPIVFNSAFTGGDWKVYVTPNVSTKDGNTGLLILISIMGLGLTLWVSYHTYKLFQTNEEIKIKNDSLNVAVMIDALTGIYNRKYLDARIIEETERVNRYNGNLSVIFFDLDHFKIVNDSFGHGNGDVVLKGVASIIKNKLRTSDIFARWGGEEFLILMPDTTLAGAAATAEKLRAVVEAIEHPIVGRVTASFGVAEYISGEYIGSWFNRVDKALYTAKANGRNVVISCESSTKDVSVLVKVNWTDELLSGNETIDKEHMEILKLGNEIIESSYHISKQNELIELANKLLNHIMKHFVDEEAILKSVGYEHLDEHITAHKLLNEKTLELVEKLGNNKNSPQELFYYLHNDVLIGHLVKADKKYFSCFQNNTVKRL